MDKSRKALSAEECFFLLNNERYLNGDGSLKGTLGETTPLVANHPACEMEQPLGENYATKSYYSNLTNELYSWIYNTNGVHYIQRINGDGTCEVVYHGDCLKLSAKPEHEITQFRAYLQLDKLCANRDGKSLIWTNGDGPIGQIDTEASIATNFFTTPFFERCADPCDFIQMCVPNPCSCLKGEFVPLDPNDAGKTNNVVDVGLKFSFIWYYYDGRQSIFADPSTLFYQNTKGCFDNTDGFPRCIKLRIPVGNPLVEKIGIAFWQNGIWKMTEIVDKYKKYNSSQQMWYERDLAELTNYSDEDCSFDYFFCNDKQCGDIDPKLISRVYNPMPIKPQFLLPIGIGEDRTALGFGNYEQGFCPVDKTEIEKVDIGIDCPVNNCNIEYATIKVRAVVHNRIHDRNQPIYRLAGTAGGEDDPTDTAYFGGLNKFGSGDLELGHDQRFVDKTRNFIVYVEGSDSWAEMRQWKAYAFWNNKESWGTVNDMEDEKIRWRRAAENGEFFYQEAEIKVIKGTRGFLRMASHKATGNAQDGSTFVIGIQNLFTYKGDSDLTDQYTDGVEEIYFDTCDGDVDVTTAFVIDDNAIDAGFTTASSSYNGYVKDKNDKPVEGAIVEIDGNESVTDHNGFYHLYLYPGTDNSVNANAKVEQDCFSFTTIKTDAILGEHKKSTQHDINIDDQTYVDGAYSNVKLLVQDCQGHPVGGVRVALSGSKYDVTNAEGYARFKIRNYESRDRQIRAVVMNNNGCFATDCNNVCNPCMPTFTSGTTSCYMVPPTVTFPSAIINRSYSLLSGSGLKAGGNYPFGFVVDYGCGLMSAVNEIKYLYIPKTQEKGKEGFCSFTYDATGLYLPGAKCVKLVRGENVNPFELQWVIDKIERVDGKIKLTIQSLNDYNEKYFFKTNTVYQWLKNDRIEFIKNGDGKIFTISQYGLLNYLTLSPFHDELISGETDAPADYFNQLIIDDDGKLDGLKEGAVIEIQRAKECTTDPVYFSICVTLEVGDDGYLLYPTGTFTTFDTYFVKRSIGKLPAQQFEHTSPSDFWGTNIIEDITIFNTDAGRAYFINRFENKRRFGRNITINAPNVFNYFGDLVRTLENDSHGDLIAASITDNQIMFALSEHDNSLHQINANFLTVGSDSLVRAANPDRIISEGQAKLSGVYGCQYPHIGSIFFGDGYVSWVDVNKHTHVIHDYQMAVAADENKCQTHFRKRCQELETWNRSHADPLDQFRFATGFNFHTGALHITIKALRNPDIYNEIKPFLKPYDTIMFHPASRDYLGYASFVQEAYGQLNLFDGLGCAFVSFYKGVPYIHPIIPGKWNEFNGHAVDRVVGVSMNKFPEKIKKGVAIELQDNDSLWFIADVSTENSNFKSETPIIKVERDRNKMNMPFLRDINSRGGLYNGKEASGYYHAVTFVKDNTINKQYGTIDDAKRVSYDSLDLIIFKFMMVGQSGFDENV